MNIEYADRTRLDGALLSFHKARLRAKVDEIDDLIKELKEMEAKRKKNSQKATRNSCALTHF